MTPQPCVFAVLSVLVRRMVCPPTTTPSPTPASPAVPAGSRSPKKGATGLSSSELAATQVEAGGRSDPSLRNATTVAELDFLPIDSSLQSRAMLEMLPVGQSFDPATTAAWLSTVSISDEADERYECASPDGTDATELGRGGTGRVLLTHDRHLGREVALKELLPEGLSSAGRKSAELRLVREARIAGQLEHPNIVTVYDMGRRSNGEMYYTMKLVRGRTLAVAIRSARDLEDRLALLGHISGLCQAIAYAHSQGVVHRDIKPDNVMIGEFGETVVLDWGGARVLPTTQNSLLLSSIPPPPEQRRWVGTPLYMSPEQVEGRVGDVDARSDVWALGVVLYQVLCGTYPFKGKSFTELSNNISEKELRSVRSVEPGVVPELAAIAERALRKVRNDRYPTAREMMRDLEAYRSGAQVSAYRYTPWERGRRLLSKNRLIIGVVAIVSFAVGVVALRGYREVSGSSSVPAATEVRASP